MKGRPIDQLVYEVMFQKPKPADPQNFHAILTRHLIFEVRSEVQAFYGELHTQEHKYPGLDYCNRIHRIRLSRWQWHRRLFRAFDYLQLTPAEIAGLTKWEGTKWAKERFEKEQGIIVRDTATDDIPSWADLEHRASAEQAEREGTRGPSVLHDEDMEGEESEEEIQSIGVPLNERLRERVALRNAGNTSLPLDEDWEQWLKNALETGEFSLVTEQIALLTNQGNSTPEEIFPSRMVNAAREGNWNEIPGFLQDSLRHSLNAERRQQQAYESARDLDSLPSIPTTAGLQVPAAAPSSENSPWRRSYSNLRLPGRDDGPSTTAELRVQQMASPPGA